MSRSATAIAVVGLSMAGFVGLQSLFESGGGAVTVGPPIVPSPVSNGAIVFANGETASTVDPATGQVVRLHGIPRGVWHVAWSPDGSRLAVTVFPPAEGPRELWVVNPDGSGAVRVASAANVSRPSWAPDGNWIAYAAQTGEGSSVHIVAADGSSDETIGETLRERNYFSASFSPDGTTLLFDEGTDSGFGIFVMGIDGSGETRISQGNSDYDPSWSPDGTRIVFTRQEDGAESDIYVMDADGSGVSRVTDGGPGATNLNPEWSPDGSLLAYQSGRNGGPGGLVIVRPDGSAPRILVEDGVLGLSWQAVPTQPTTTPTAETVGRDIGLPFRLCDVSTLGGVQLSEEAAGRVWVGARVTDSGECPGEFISDHVVAADVDADSAADTWTEMACRGGCRPSPRAATDLNADGLDEVFVLQDLFSIASYQIVTMVGGDLTVATVAEPGHPEGDFRAGEAALLSVGGDEGYGSWLRCEGYPDSPRIVATWSTHPVEGPGSDVKDVHETTLALRADGSFAVLDASDTTLPVGVTPPGVTEASTCGADLRL